VLGWGFCTASDEPLGIGQGEEEEEALDLVRMESGAGEVGPAHGPRAARDAAITTPWLACISHHIIKSIRPVTLRGEAWALS
jgi:hypothetical protein